MKKREKEILIRITNYFRKGFKDDSFYGEWLSEWEEKDANKFFKNSAEFVNKEINDLQMGDVLDYLISKI